MLSVAFEDNFYEVLFILEQGWGARSVSRNKTSDFNGE